MRTNVKAQENQSCMLASCNNNDNTRISLFIQEGLNFIFRIGIINNGQYFFMSYIIHEFSHHLFFSGAVTYHKNHPVKMLCQHACFRCNNIRGAVKKDNTVLIWIGTDRSLSSLMKGYHSAGAYQLGWVPRRFAAWKQGEFRLPCFSDKK